MNFRRVKTILEKAGWKHVRTKGSHYQFRNPEGKTITVPYHAGKDISLNVLKSIERNTGLHLL